MNDEEKSRNPPTQPLPFTSQLIQMELRRVLSQSLPVHIKSLKMANSQSGSGRIVFLVLLTVVILILKSNVNNSSLAGEEAEEVNHSSCAYKCHNGLCLTGISLVCDQRDDCGDNSDEFHCGKSFMVNSYSTPTLIKLISRH